MDAEKVIAYFDRFLPLSAEEKAFVERVFVARHIKKKEVLLSAGNVCRHNTFVVSGCFRMYLIDAKGKEHNLQFAMENWWIGDIGSFHSERPSALYIVALEDSEVLQIHKEDQLRLFVDFPKFNRIFRVFTENALVSAQNRILQNISSTAEERYLDFIQRYPGLLNRISNVQIASYLGVTPEFLSTIRGRIAKA